jgi:hypothetical protein
MMSYKDQTFCHDWCATETCFRNYKHIKDSQQDGGFLHQNPWMPIAFYVAIPEYCKERTHKDES